MVPPLPLGGDVAAILDGAGAVEGAHVVVIGERRLEVMCGLIRRGCTAAAEMALHERSVIETADIALVPHILTLEAATRAVALARRALISGGRIVLHDPSGLLARQIGAVLRRAGFSSVRARVRADGAVLTAELPFFGPMARA